MAQWQMRLDLSPIWGKLDDKHDPWTVERLAMDVAIRIRMLPCFRAGHRLYDYHDDFNDIAAEFECVTEVEEFDCWMNELYDLGDRQLDHTWNGKRLCWINTQGGC